MYVLINAVANLGRNKGRNILLSILIFIILFVSTISVSIFFTSKGLIEGYRVQFSSSIILTRINEKLPSDLEDYREPDIKDYKNYATSSLLKQTELITSITASIENGKALDEDKNDSFAFELDEGVHEGAKNLSTNIIYGTNNEQISAEFVDGKRTIIQGRMYKQVNETVISKELAELNEWKIGNIIQVTLPTYLSGETEKLQLVLVGIYEDKSNEYSDDKNYKTAITNRRNEIFTNMETLLQISDDLSVTANFTIKNPELIDQLNVELHEKGLPDYFEAKTDDSSYKTAIAPLETLQKMTFLFTIVLLSAGIILLLIITSIAMKERTYEIGVLRAIGMKKWKIVASLFSEIVIITTICLLLSLSSASLCSKPIANALYNMQTKQTSEKINTDDMDQLSFVSVEQIKQLNTGIDNNVIFVISSLSILLAGVSSMIGIIRVMRYEPLYILSERN